MESGEVTYKNNTCSDILQYICHSILMMRRSGNIEMNRPMLSKYAFLTAVGSYFITNDMNKSLFAYLNFNVQKLAGCCCNECSNQNIINNFDTLEYYKIKNKYFKEFKSKDNIDWHTILSDRLGNIKTMIDNSLIYLFDTNPLIFEYDLTDLSNITKQYNSVRLDIRYIEWADKYYLNLSPTIFAEYDKEIIADCWYYERFYPLILNNEPDKLAASYPHLYAKDYPYLDLINLYPEHPLYNSQIVKYCETKSRMLNRYEWFSKINQRY